MGVSKATLRLDRPVTDTLQKRLSDYLYSLYILKNGGHRSWVQPEEIKNEANQKFYQEHRKEYEDYAKRVTNNCSADDPKLPCYIDALMAAKYLKGLPTYKGKWSTNPK